MSKHPKILRRLKPLMDRRVRLLAGTVAFWAIGLVALDRAGLGDFLESRVIRALEFRVREALGRTPAVDRRLKVFGLDDNTAAMLGSTRLSPKDWTLLFEALARRKPRAIIVDGMFASDQELTPEERDRARALAHLDTPIAVGALYTPATITYRSEIPSSRFDDAWRIRHPDMPAARGNGAKVYGPAPLYQEAFRHIGHVVQQGSTRFAPAVRIGPKAVLPHVGLFVVGTRAQTAAGVLLDGKRIPVDSDGLAVVNHLSPKTAAALVKGLRGILLKARDGGRIETVSEGDVVLIIANYSTGNTDIFESPLGLVPGGYIIASIINSALTGAWIKPVSYEPALVALSGAAGAFAGYFCASGLFFLVTGLGVLAILATALVAFAYAAMALPWLFPLAAFVGAGLTCYAFQRYAESRRRMQLEMEIAVASTLQRKFLPRATLEHEKFSLAAYYHPADQVGGDWFAYYLVDDRWLHVHLGDITGHGPPAAMLASFAKGATDMIYAEHAKSGQGNVPLAHLHEQLNELMHRDGNDSSFMTLWSSAIDLATGACHCLRTAHPAGLLASADGIKRMKMATSPAVLGHFSMPVAPTPTVLQLAGDETILAFSDGLTDVPTSRGIVTYESGLRRHLSKLLERPSDAIRAGLIRALGLDKGGQFIDDVTFVVIKLKLATGVSVGASHPSKTAS